MESASVNELSVENAVWQAPPVCFKALWKAAWRSIDGKILFPLLIIFLPTIINNVISIPITRLPAFAITPPVILIGICFWPMGFGVALFFLHRAKGEEGKIGDLFKPYKHFLRYILVHLYLFWRTFCFTLLFVIPGIIVTCRYFLTDYIALEHPELSADEAIMASSKMMRGHKWTAFGYLLLWGLIFFFGTLFTLGIAFFWLLPMWHSFRANFYVAVKTASPNDLIETVKSGKKKKLYFWSIFGIIALVELITVFCTRSALYLLVAKASGGEEAVKWYLKSAELGNLKAQKKIARMYEFGSFVQEDKAEAFKWYRKAAEQGDPEAQWLVGSAYDCGSGVLKDKAEALKWYRKAAEQGNAYAQYDIALAYDCGSGVPKSKAEAFKWYQKSAEQGYASAQNALAFFYEIGLVVPKDFWKAVKWHRRAARQGNLWSQDWLKRKGLSW